MSKRVGRGAALFAAVAAIVLVAPTAASAHITVNPSTANQGGFSAVAFRVPNERDDSGTSSVQVTFPDDAVLPFVSVQPVPGWTYEVARRTLEEPVDAEGTEITEVVDSITWTGGPIAPGEYQEFNVSMGPLPDDVDVLTFPTVQTYESGEEVRWIEETPESGEEPELPVPTLTLEPSTGDEHGGGEEAEGEGAESEDAESEDAESEDGEAAAAADDDGDGEGDDDGTDGVAVAALIVGIFGVLLGGAALVLGRKSSS